MKGAYLNDDNTKSIVFQTLPTEDVNQNKILIAEDNVTNGSKIDAFTQAQVISNS